MFASKSACSSAAVEHSRTQQEDGAEEERKFAVVGHGEAASKLDVESEIAEADNTLVDQRPRGSVQEQPQLRRGAPEPKTTSTFVAMI